MHPSLTVPSCSGPPRWVHRSASAWIRPRSRISTTVVAPDRRGDRLALDELRHGDGVGPSGRRPLERGRVDADAHGVGEVSTQPRRGADDPEAGQGEPRPVSVERLPCRGPCAVTATTPR